MRIVIDMQGAQSSGSRNRGVGRYTLSLAQALARNRGRHELLLALNGLFPETIEPIRQAFDGLLPQDNIRVWQAPRPVSFFSAANDWRRKTAELLREAFLASLKADVIIESSLFEGLADDAVTSIGALNRNIPTAAILYDLIPLIYKEIYAVTPAHEAWYQDKLSHLRQADLLLAISESSRQEGLRYLDFSAETCITISTACDRQFQPQHIGLEQEQTIRRQYGLQQAFVLYTGGNDYRKNIEGLIRAYAKLPTPLRATHQLAIVCSFDIAQRIALEKLINTQGLKPDEVVLTGFVPDQDLLALYNLCKVFVFPSWHEGFGLPALEAMSCGRAVIAANTSSLPEVIGRDDALFDPLDDNAITEKLEKVLTDEAFRSALEQHGLERAKLFSWDAIGQRAISAIEALAANKRDLPASDLKPATRPRLAYLSPLPPMRSGISDYSAMLLPELLRYYEIDVIAPQASVSNSWITANCPLRSVEWFRANSNCFDRVLYHFGNSDYHQAMFGLLDEIPGVVVLHDFFLSGIVAQMDTTGYQPGCWGQALYQSHGYAALQQRFLDSDRGEVILRYPCNHPVLQNALGVIIHSEHSRRLANQWYGQGAADDWPVIPLLRSPRQDIDKVQARQLLKLDKDDFIVCSFGHLAPAKLNHRLLEAWLASALAKNAHCLLVFVGENHPGDYGAGLVAAIQQSGLSERIRITGWTDAAAYQHYLAAADVGVQLRTLSRGETSAAVLDCMNYRLATIVNANGSMADLPDNGVWKLADAFGETELAHALETLWRDPSRRRQLGARAEQIIASRHNPASCAGQYSHALETQYQAAACDVAALTAALAKVEPAADKPGPLISLAEAVALSIPPQLAPRQLFIDISALVQQDLKTGIQRVVRSILKELLDNPPAGYRVEPVYAMPGQGYRYARQFTLAFLACPAAILIDEAIEFKAGDQFLGLDLHAYVVLQQAFYQKLRRFGVGVKFVVYDLLPITLPHAFNKGTKTAHQAWLQVVTESDGAICISKAVSATLSDWIQANGATCSPCFKIDWFHLGADINASQPSKGLPNNAKTVLNGLHARPSFLMVGTVEPRKAHKQALAAFELLWERGVDVNLLIVGKQGWLVDDLAAKLRRHPELNRRLFWLENISDEFLQALYAHSACLIAASEDEGFGLPLIEAAQYRLPIIARAIPVFKEVALDHATYFSGLAPLDLADTVNNWLALKAQGSVPQSSAMPWLTWQESARQLIGRLALSATNPQGLSEDVDKKTIQPQIDAASDE